ncbi:hypothetical protein R6242_16125 [Iodobacter sp. CM08]|uniref:hypothetical protein n=1 Tax=Iodobacter sp. CM08 TaxID=3085902 RepID=UPI0029821A04|nr:hypothetical protein [Iodobacter sp. CM08]MDW5418094.1 hypothetical protein [Iodobacter sp. CM08]
MCQYTELVSRRNHLSEGVLSVSRALSQGHHEEGLFHQMLVPLLKKQQAEWQSELDQVDADLQRYEG